MEPIYTSSLYPSLSETRHEGQSSHIVGFQGKVIDNIQVGGRGSDYRKLSFQANELQDIVPGQFIMVNTRPTERIRPMRPTNLANIRSHFDLQPKSYLKRPFGIHRAFYENFCRNYLQHLRLPRDLSRILHTVQPNKFDIFFKILQNGTGTKELAQLRRDDRIEMIGPLGKRFDLRELRDRGIQEIHVIGGGVGMAPLIFLVQALRFYSFRIVAFLGIERFEVLQHEDPMAESYVADTRDTKIYIDDLLAAGLKKSQIHVSLDKMPKNVPHIVHSGNIHNGFVSQQYERYLKQQAIRQPSSIQAFSCGPFQMMKAVHQVTHKQGIPLEVFLEKRMACGFGVCLSCVQQTKVNGGHKYSRVCTDGPVFDSDKIKW